MKKIPLSNGIDFAKVDDEDYESLSRYTWHASPRYVTNTRKVSGKTRSVLMHRMVMGLSSGGEIDHINGDRFDNRKENLRICSKSQNNMNRGLSRKVKSSQYKGVSRHVYPSGYHAWFATVTKNRKVVYHKIFHLELDAAKAYDRVAKSVFGKFACVNFSEAGHVFTRR